MDGTREDSFRLSMTLMKDRRQNEMPLSRISHSRKYDAHNNNNNKEIRRPQQQQDNDDGDNN